MKQSIVSYVSIGNGAIAIEKKCHSTLTVENVYIEGFESFDPFKMSTKVYKKVKYLFAFIFIAMS